MRLNIKAQGIDSAIKGFSKRSLEARGVADKVTETYTRKMANESAKNAPVLTGDLRASIASSPLRLKLGTWQYGSDLDYALIQEYEHHSKSGFIRNSLWNNEKPYQDALKREVTKD